MSHPHPVALTTSPMSVGQMMERSWISVKNEIALVAGLSLVMVIASFSLGAIPIVGWLASPLVGVGYIACLFRLRRGEKFDFADFLWAFQNFNRVIHVILAYVLASAAALLGFVLFIIPGVWIYVMLSLTTVLQVRHDLDGVNAVKRSYELVTGSWWRTAGVLLFLLGLNILGALCFLLGLLVTMPLSVLVLAELAEDLEREKSPISGHLTSPPQDPGSSNFQVNPV